MFVRFILVGGLATAIHYFILVLMVQVAGASPVLASSFGFSLSAGFNYLLNRKLTFASDRGHVEAAPRFLIVTLVGLSLNSVIVWLLVSLLAWHYLLAQLLATCITIFWNYFANKYWTFRSRSAESISS